MKSTVLKPLVLSFLLLLAASVAGVARGGWHRQGEDRPVGREVKAYVEAKVLPVLRQQRQKLEPQLAAADRAQLATYRAQLQDLKARGEALRQRLRPAGAGDGASPVLTPEQQQEVHALRSEARGVMLSVAQMAQRYAAALTQLAQEVQPQKEQWTTDIKGIVAKNATPEQQQRLAAFGGRMREHGALRRFFRPVLFLLMDPAAPDASAEPGMGASSFYPNPAAASTQLAFEVEKAGPITVELLDGNGHQLRALLAETTAEKGLRTVELDLHDLPAGTYFYKITTKAGSETKRFVKE